MEESHEEQTGFSVRVFALQEEEVEHMEEVTAAVNSFL